MMELIKSGVNLSADWRMPSVPKYFIYFLSCNFLMTSIVRMVSSMELPRERSASGRMKPWMIGPAIVQPPRCSRDL